MSEAFINGGWRQFSKKAEAYIGGKWRQLTRAEMYIDGEWRKVLSFALPLSISTIPSAVTGTNNFSRPIKVTSDPVFSTPSGGLAPYTYAWTILNGGAVPSSPASASTNFTQTVNPGSTQFSAARVTITDALGTTATADVAISLTNGGF